MSYNSTMGRREFSGKLIKGLLGLYAGVTGLAKSSRADDLVEDKEILSKFSELYKKVKGRGNEFDYEEKIDVDGDNTPDNVKFKLYDGSVTVGTDVTSGKRFEVEFKVGGWERRIYGIVNGDQISPAKRRWLDKDDAKKYLDALLQHLEK